MSGYYRIRHKVEEADCTQCGWPGYVGDRMYEGTDGDCYCSKACADKAEALQHSHTWYAELAELPPAIRTACTLGAMLDKSADR